MVLTVPLGLKRRLTIALTRKGGLRAAAWRKRTESKPPCGDDWPAALTLPVDET